MMNNKEKNRRMEIRLLRLHALLPVRMGVYDLPGFVEFHCPSCGASMTTAEGWDNFSREVVFNGDDVS